MIEKIREMFSGIAFVVLCLTIPPAAYLKWKLFGKHELSDYEKAFNKKIENACDFLDKFYVKHVAEVMADDSNLMMNTALPYSEVKVLLDDVFEAFHFDNYERIRAFEPVKKYEKTNGPEYEFSLGGRSECFLLQSRLRESEYVTDPEPWFEMP